MNTIDTVKVAAHGVQARMEVTDVGVIMHAPVSFKGTIIADTGMWTHQIDPSAMSQIAGALAKTHKQIKESAGRTAQHRAEQIETQ